MTPELLLKTAIIPALSLLDPTLDTPAARMARCGLIYGGCGHACDDTHDPVAAAPTFLPAGPYSS